MKVQFETGLDDLVDANVRFAMSTKWVTARRRRSILSAGTMLALSMFVVAIVMNNGWSPTGFVLYGAIAIAFGVGFGFVYKTAADSYYRRRLRAYLQDQLGDRSAWICEIELREEGLWSRDHGIEMLFPWADVTVVDDVDDGVHLQCRAGFVFARNRAFATADDRTRFVETAKALARG